MMEAQRKNVILIIDDNDMKRYSVTRQLLHLGYEVVEARTGAEGRANLASNPDLIVLDVKLPDCNGFDFCAELKADPAYSTIPVLMVSASFVEAQHRALGLNIGADGYLTTPIDPLELQATIGALLRVRDTEEQLRKEYLRAESANVAKTEFLANMSHEIRTPMNAILGLNHIMRKTNLDDKQRKCTETMQDAAESLLILINDMLDIAKIEDQTFELERRAFSLRQLMARLISMMAVKANEKNLELIVNEHEPMLDFIIGDELRIQQILINLINNALKFTPKGKVAVDVKSTRNDSGNYDLSLRVKDTGIGIAREKLALIFEKFTQSDSSITREYGGTGLGLSITKTLIERMGGSIEVNSALDKGTTFTVTIPVEKANVIGANTTSAAPEQPIKPANAKTVLLVEDYAPNILVATTLLEQFGYRYDTAINGIEALEKVKKTEYGVILMDIQMHEMDGFETTRHIREWEATQNRPKHYIIAMTAHALHGDREKCLDSGMNDYVSKPFDPVVLQQKLAGSKS